MPVDRRQQNLFEKTPRPLATPHDRQSTLLTLIQTLLIEALRPIPATPKGERDDDVDHV